MKSTYKTEAVVLKVWDLSEKDRIALMLSPFYGKFDAVFKGAKKLTGKNVGKAEPMNRLRLLVSVGKSLDTVSQAELAQAFPCIRQDLERSAAAIYMLDLVNRRVEKGEKNPPLYQLLCNSLHMLEKGVTPEIVNRTFEIKLIAILGYKPKLDGCVCCGKEGDFCSLDVARGGAVCFDCGNDEADTHLSISPGAIALLRFLEKSNSVTASRVTAEGWMLNEIKNFLARYMSYNLPGSETKESAYNKLFRKA